MDLENPRPTKPFNSNFRLLRPMVDRSSIFDMIGPVMIGPSSSHTAGVVRIGRVGRFLFDGTPEKATITFYNSFARTYEGHGSDRAVIGGLLGYSTEDERIKNALDHAQKANLAYHFKSVNSANSLHPNTIHIEMEGNGKKTSVRGISKGGGVISIVAVDGFKCNFSGQHPTLIIDSLDVKGSIAFTTNIVALDDSNIATMSVDRESKDRNAKMVIEMDSPLRPLSLDYMRNLSWVTKVIYIPDFNS